MARIRYIKPEFFEDQKLGRVSIAARLLYVGLFCHLDKQGVCEYSPEVLRGKIFPYDVEIDFAALVNELVGAERIVVIRFAGNEYLFCPTFSRHQKFHPREHEKYNIPEEILKDTAWQPASSLPATAEALPSSVGIGIGNWELVQEQRPPAGRPFRTQDPYALHEKLWSEDTDKIRQTLAEIFKHFGRSGLTVQLQTLLPKLCTYFETYDQFLDEVKSLAASAESKKDPARYLESSLVAMIRDTERAANEVARS